ncbi:ATP-grasp domain-containing protein [Aegicerativicinus sediminis]
MANKLYLISPESAESGTLETLPITEGMTLLKDNQMLSKDFCFQKDDKICITSEASLELVKNKIDDTAKKQAINLLKDKYNFREILTNIYPDYQFEKIKFDSIKGLKIDKKTVLKPSKGCFGTAVKIIDESSDLIKVSKEIELEIQKNSSVLSSNVLSQNDFILEDYISGEEYAIDMFYNENGEPHIVNIYYHPLPRVEAYLHMIYYTSKEIFDKIYDKAIAFFKQLNKILNVKNFVIHSEFKYDKELIPIEINSMRFGGMGLGNMIYHTIGVNPYEYFIHGKSPNWKEIWAKNANDIYAFFIAYNGTKIDKSANEPNLEKLRLAFTEILREEIFDYKKQLAFGIFCIKENKQNIKKLLEIEFNDYFKPITK